MFGWFRRGPQPPPVPPDPHSACRTLIEMERGQAARIIELTERAHAAEVAGLRARISDLEEQITAQQERREEERQQAAGREREILDRLLAVLNPAAARVMQGPASVQVPLPPRPTPNYDDKTAPVSRVRQPLLTPEQARFLHTRRAAAVQAESGEPELRISETEPVPAPPSIAAPSSS
jgi:hypothetical protein